jgi:hypothetical protein
MGWQAGGALWAGARPWSGCSTAVVARFALGASRPTFGRVPDCGGCPLRGLLGASRPALVLPALRGLLGAARPASGAWALRARPSSVCSTAKVACFAGLGASRPTFGRASGRDWLCCARASRAWALRARLSGGPLAGWLCRERRVRGMPSAVKGAFTALSAGNAPFTASPMPVTRLSRHRACPERALQDARGSEGAHSVSERRYPHPHGPGACGPGTPDPASPDLVARPGLLGTPAAPGSTSLGPGRPSPGRLGSGLPRPGRPRPGRPSPGRPRLGPARPAVRGSGRRTWPPRDPATSDLAAQTWPPWDPVSRDSAAPDLASLGPGRPRPGLPDPASPGPGFPDLAAAGLASAGLRAIQL